MGTILDSEIKFLPGVGPRRAELLQKELGINTFRDMLYTFPFRYVDRSKFYSVREIDSTNTYIQLRGHVTSLQVVGAERGKRLVAAFTDGTGTIDLVFFKGLKWMQDRLKVGGEYIVFGKPSLFNHEYNLVHPEIDPATEEKLQQTTGHFLGVYNGTENLRSAGLGNKAIAKLQATLLAKVLPEVRETLPEYLLLQRRLCPLRFALQNIHFPQDIQSLSKAQERLKFEELFFLQLSMLKQKSIRMRGAAGAVFKRIGTAFNKTYSNIPFPLTGAQKRVLHEIRDDVGSGRQMNRLLQGDVGSGKTMVALMTMLIAIDNGYQACIMAPTEILSEQHFANISRFIEGLGLRAELLTGSIKGKRRAEILKGLKDGSVNILVSTHAVLEDPVEFSRLGFVVIDEQHRFGVAQRARLWSKSTMPPHVLVMTATPIPRTLAMTLYGDLDVSVIDELPPGRKPIQTDHYYDGNHKSVYAFLDRELKKGRQAYIVYPLIEESEKIDLKNLEEGYLTVCERFQGYGVSKVHGRMKPAEKDAEMQRFKRNETQIMVATTVIEVGVDVPNASIMVIENANRFGLSQLHQLRGRVGRGADQSYCLLVTPYQLSEDTRKRIEIMTATCDGFEIAEADLKLRGPGDLEGTQQSGMAFDLKLANLARDGALIEHVREIAKDIIAQDAELAHPQNQLLGRMLRRLKKSEYDWSSIS